MRKEADTLKALKQLEEKEPLMSKECFQEYRKGNKTLKQIATEKNIKYNTIRHYSTTYKYKARIELLHPSPQPQVRTPEKNPVSEKTNKKKKQPKNPQEAPTHTTKITTLNQRSYTHLRNIEETTPITTPVGVPPFEDEKIIRTVEPEEVEEVRNTFHEYRLHSELKIQLLLTEKEKKKLLSEAKSLGYMTFEDYLLSNMKNLTLTIDNFITNKDKNKDHYNKQEDTLKLHDLNRYKPKLFSSTNPIQSCRQFTLDEIL